MPVDFDQTVAPLLIRSCLECHSGLEPEGRLDLSNAAGLARGGESGAAIVSGDVEASRLWQRVRDGDMPPKQPLSPADQQILQNWIAAGAVWGTDPLDPFRLTTDRRAGADWWSLQPLTTVSPPPATSEGERNVIDRFVALTLQQHGLRPAAAADRRVLIRRLTFDLLGLPPTPEEVDAFLSDNRPGAYERLVDRLLASPHYGVRWGRHWLDIARFGESQGFERDKLREDSWPYRDWVVNAFNSDMPYTEFARLQLAGDVLPGSDINGVIATGFLVAGAWDEVGQKQQSAAMKAVVRQDELEDYVSVVGQSFLGLTIHCARCHDHKFDPIKQAEYYQLTAALDGVQHGSRTLFSEADRDRKRTLAHQREQLAAELRQLDALAQHRVLTARGDEESVSPSAPRPLARWTFDANLGDDMGSLTGKAEGKLGHADGAIHVGRPDGHVRTAPIGGDITAKTLEAWVQLDNLEQRGGGVIGLQTLDGVTFDAIVFGEREPGHWMAGSDGFQRTQSFQATAETEATSRFTHVAISYEADGTIRGYRDGQPYGVPYKSRGPVTYKAGQAQVTFGLRHSPPGGNKHLAGMITAAQLYDRALTPAEVAASAEAGPRAVTEAELLAAMSDAERTHRTQLHRQLDSLDQADAMLQPLSAYVVSPRQPQVTQVLLRGNPQTPAGEVAPGGVAALAGVDAGFALAPQADDAARRTALAAWITHHDNPLFARVMVNRVWHHHFGRGLVETTSDFGFNGGRPSHPELLDWLAGEFRGGGYSVKSLHRLIVTSATYRQSSAYDAASAAIDADNRLLWRMSPRRLEAEELRDTLLAVTGSLNGQLGGPGYQDFETYVHNSQFYNITDPVGPEFERRTLYRTWIRSARSPLLDVFDCPDPSTKTPNRASTITPLQALSLLNNTFVLRMSDRLASRLRDEAGDGRERAGRSATRTHLQPPAR
ncbi:MAG: DUF1553 domain-containing protein [Planctomycetaceae bacterium]